MEDYPQPGTQRALIWDRAERLMRVLGAPPAFGEVFEADGVVTLRTAEIYYYEWLRTRGLMDAARERRRQMRAAGIRALPPSRQRGALLAAIGRPGRRTRLEILADIAESDRLRAAHGLPPIPIRDRFTSRRKNYVIPTGEPEADPIGEPEAAPVALVAAPDPSPIHPAAPGALIWRTAHSEETHP